MLCALFGLLIATLFWAWLGPWAGAVGALSAAALFLTLRTWPKKSKCPSEKFLNHMSRM